MSSTDAGQAHSHGQSASRAVLGRGSLFTIGTAAPILAQTLVTPFVTRILGPNHYGLVAQAIVVIQVTMMLASLGMPSVITRQALMTENGIPRARSLFVRSCLLTLALGLVAAAIAFVSLSSQSSTQRWTWVFALLAGTGFVMTENGQALLRATDRPVAFISISGITMLGGPVLGLAALLGLSRSPAYYVGGLAIGYLTAGAIAWLICLGPTLRAQRAYETGDMRIAFKLGLPILPHMVALYLLSMSLVLIAAQHYGVEASGRIQLALLVGTAPNVITSSLNNSWAPTIFATDEAHRGAVLEHTARDIAMLAALVSSGVALLSPWLLMIVASHAYSPAQLVPAVCVVCVGSMLSVAYLANVQLVFAAGKPYGLSFITPISLIVGVAAAFALSQASLTAVAAGFPIAYATLGLGVALLRRRIEAPRWRESRLVPVFVLGAIFILLGAALPASGSWSLVRWPLAVVAGVLLLLTIKRVLRPAVTA